MITFLNISNIFDIVILWQKCTTGLVIANYKIVF